MPYTLGYDEQDGILLLTITGRVDMAEVRSFAPKVLQQLIENHALLVLNDMREAQVALSTIEIYDLPHLIGEMAKELGAMVQKTSVPW